MRKLALPRLSVVAVAALAALACSDMPTTPTSDFAKGGNPGPPGGTTDLPVSIASCQAEFEALHAAIGDAESLKDRDRDGLLAKNVEAADKVNEGKPGDALQKFDDLESKLAGLLDAAKPKISQEDFDAISAALGEAGACVSALLL